MEKIKKIINNPKFVEKINQLKEYEKDRVFCNHTLEHFIDVARIMYIMSLENNENLDKELIYATALLHDLGRVYQYKDGTPHNIAGHEMISEIMENAGFDSESITRTLNAIKSHRDLADSQDVLATYLYKADKKSRNCFNCQAYEQCNWNQNKKNMTIEI